MSYDKKFYTAEIMVAEVHSKKDPDQKVSEKCHGEKIVNIGEATTIPELQKHIFEYFGDESIEWDVETCTIHVFRDENEKGDPDPEGEFEVDYQIAVWRVEIPEFEEILEEIQNES